MQDYEIGDVVISKAGHDKGLSYVIINIDKDFVYLADGRLKKIEKPKKKNVKHIHILHIDNNYIKNKCIDNIKDEEIKYFLKAYGGNNV